ncbi:hypothetical protein [Oscillibacter sp.]|uniref:hypothetical protein n=1 Tax=Oscillibacter sp. TaxID=1945593 RepID=UPI00257DB623|nr:hypothetical protein [Oscillibacter sp.]
MDHGTVRRVDGYSPVEVNNGNVSEYPSAGDNYGWYYVLEDEFNFRVQLRWGNLGGAEGIAEAIYNSFDFVVDTNYTASSLRRLLAEMKDQMKIEEDPDGDPDNPTSGTVTVSGLWKYNLDGSRINYSVEETREETEKATAGWTPPTASRRVPCPRATTSRSPTTTPARPTWAQRWGSSMTAAACT